MLYEICDPDDENALHSKKATLSDYAMAVDLYYSENFVESETLFTKVLATNRDDTPARLFLEKIQSILKNGTPPGWDGTTYYDTKS